MTYLGVPCPTCEQDCVPILGFCPFCAKHLRTGIEHPVWGPENRLMRRREQTRLASQRHRARFLAEHGISKRKATYR